MSWTKLLANNSVQRHTTAKRELDAMRALIARDLADAAIPALSEDRRFATAYNAALQACTMAVACAGYRVTAKTGHHIVTIECSVLAMGKPAQQHADYFDNCRRKRNQIDYIFANVATETEADELLIQAKAFAELVEHWIAQHYPQFKP